MVEQMSDTSEEFAIVRRRMRHLARLNIEPKPILRHASCGLGPLVAVSLNQRASHLGWQVVAVQMSNAAPMSALD